MKKRSDRLLLHSYMPKSIQLMYLLEEGTIALEGGREEVLNNKHVKEAFLGI